ncbi:MAG TPA: DinB family protein [Thermoanaerobaculia bacterium]|nr:DinB family protein [Thermoanaerobaculia bacterium]
MTLGDQLRASVDRATPLLLAMSDDIASAPRAPEKWSRKQILGHLIDSAANNHQRFVRVEPDGFRYEQNDWVETQQYARASWPSLIALWREYNLHLAHVIDAMSDDTQAKLDTLIVDYIAHLEHHLGQIG